VGPLSNFLSLYGVRTFVVAGQSLVEYNVIAYGNSDNPLLTALFVSSNRNSGMTDVYVQYINAYVANKFITGLNPFMQFSSCGAFTKYGSWGVFEYTGQLIETSPKYMALRQFFYYNDPNQMLMRFPSKFQSIFSSVSSMVSSKVKYMRKFLSDIKVNGVVPYEFDTSCVVCVTNNVFCPSLVPWNADYSYVGFPYVTSPRYGDVLVAGHTYTLTWNVPVDGTKIGSTVSIRLWKNAYCGLHGTSSGSHNGILVKDWSSSTTTTAFARGRVDVVLPLLSSLSYDDDTAPTFFFELRGMHYHSYFSEVFSVTTTMPLLGGTLTPCSSNSSSNNNNQQVVLSACTVSNTDHLTSLSTTIVSALTVFPVKPNQPCMLEYTSHTLSNTQTSLANIRLSSCYTSSSSFASSSCRLIRTVAFGKPILDCVSNLSPYPSLSLRNKTNVLLTPQSAVDYDTFVSAVGYHPLQFFTADECRGFVRQVNRFPSSSLQQRQQLTGNATTTTTMMICPVTTTRRSLRRE
jgi:hypothetical protein